MIKYITNSWQFREPCITKSASWYSKYESTPDYTYVSALFLGSGEFWGPNRNGDFFKEKTLVDRYKTFLNGKHYHHHENEDPTKSFGDVVDVRYNNDMHRVEGVIKIINKLSPETIKRIDKGENVPLSMACRVPYDICSICGKKSFIQSDYCDHLKKHMTDIMEDGRQVYAINPDPDFFDISEVVIGADPTACIFKKIASKKDFFIDKCATSDKLAILDKMSEIEKYISGVIDGKISKDILSKNIGKKQIKNVGKKTATLLRPNDLGLRGKCLIYDALKKQSHLIGKVELDDGGESPKDRDLTYNPDREPIRFSNVINKSKDLAKVAAINIEILYNNPSLLEDRLALQASILQNFI